jgi:hypothetical protein
MPKKFPARTAAETAARKTESAAAGERRRISKAAPASAVSPTVLSPALRSTLEQLAASAFARIGFAPDEAPRLRSEVRHLRRQVALQARQIQQLRANQATAAGPADTPPATEGSRAARAVQAWQRREADVRDAPPDDSQAVRRRWIDEGLLVPTADLAHSWGLTRQALDQARERGDLVGLKIANRQYYPAVFLELKAEDVASICRSLMDVDPVSRIIFWQRPHASLDGQTLAQAIRSVGSAAAMQVAEAFADEQAGVMHAGAEAKARAHAA